MIEDTKAATVPPYKPLEIVMVVLSSNPSFGFCTTSLPLGYPLGVSLDLGLLELRSVPRLVFLSTKAVDGVFHVTLLVAKLFAEGVPDHRVGWFCRKSFQIAVR